MIWILVAIIVVLVCVAAAFAVRQRRTAQLREGFGPEYDRVVGERGDQRAGEAELAERRDRRRSYDIRPLRPEERSAMPSAGRRPSRASSTSPHRRSTRPTACSARS